MLEKGPLVEERVKISRECVRCKDARHVKVFGERDTFAGWPFNNGFEQYGEGNELVVSYSRFRCKLKVRPDGSEAFWTGPHPDTGRRRSLDGGKTWRREPGFPWSAATVGTNMADGDLSTLEDAWRDRIVRTQPIDPFNRDHGMIANTASVGGTSRSFVFTTRDRGRTWSGPSFLPMDGVKFSHNRPVWLVRPDGVLLTFPTVARGDGTEGRSYVYASFDGGVTWNFLSVMAQSDDYMLIMPTAVNLASGRTLAAVRVQHPPNGLWTELYDSADGARSWRFIGRLNDHGAPAQLLTLADGRIVGIYGCRKAPFGIRARVSEDAEGWRWGPEIILRDDGASDDLGYPRGAVLPDGTVCVAYYFHEKQYPKPPDCDQFHWGVRSIFATRFRV